jgi:hypothetical protein
MKVDKLVKRGNIHPNYCEDAVFETSLDENWLIGCVMDGCSSGKDSHFASALFVKLVGKACKTLPYLSKIQPELALSALTPQYIGEFILSQVFNDVKSLHKKLIITEIELLSTLLLAVVHKHTKEGWINISGDGYISINDAVIEIEQNNIPDYLAYHLDLNFDKWLKDHTISYESVNISKLSISTDGINKLLDIKGLRSKKVNPVDFMLSVKQKTTDSLEVMYNELNTKHQLVPFDDLGIIRFG